VRRPENSLRGAEICSEHYSISERDSAEAAIQDAARRALSHYCSMLGGVAVTPGFRGTKTRARTITRCAGTKSHTYDESWHRIECRIFTI
jgi:hypothetical protein